MKILQKNITIISRKFDQSINRSWKADLIEKKNSLLVFKGIFDIQVNHSILGVIRPGTISYEFYWLDKWFNVFRFHEPDGTFKNFYCNINMPPVFENGFLDYVDLDIDVIVFEDFTYHILDLVEFEANSAKYKYSAEIKSKAQFQLQSLLKKIRQKDFPFDFFLFDHNSPL